MKRNLYQYICLAIAVAFSTACRKYVEIPQEQQRVLETTADYQGILNNSTLMESSFILPVYASDEIGADTVLWQNNLNNNSNGLAYTWAEKLTTSNTAEDQDWSALYRGIFYANLVINNVLNSKGGTDAEKHKAYAAALVNRALFYHMLANIYCKPYDAATAATDLGMPLRTDDLIKGSLSRATLQHTYDLILSDLNTALADAALPDLPDYNVNASKAAAYGVLARVYLSMRNFTEALKAANNALQIQGSLLNLNNYLGGAITYPQKHQDPEIIFSKTVNSGNLPLSPSLMNLFADTSDLRFQLFTRKGSEIGLAYLTRVLTRSRIANQAYISGITVPEMMLIKAECEARAGNVGNSAVNTLNALRKTRFKPAQYTDLSAANSAEALDLVIRERRIELMGRGFRWFDQRRLTKDNLTPTITRKFKEVTYTLAPGSNRYVFPIADKYITLNPEIEQNPR